VIGQFETGWWCDRDRPVIGLCWPLS